MALPRSDRESSDRRIPRIGRRPFDRLREAIDEEVDTVLGLDDVLIDDQLLALVLANLGQESLDRPGRAAGCFLNLALAISRLRS